MEREYGEGVSRGKEKLKARLAERIDKIDIEIRFLYAEWNPMSIFYLPGKPI